MSLTMIQILAGAFFVVSLFAGVWLVLHLTSLGSSDILGIPKRLEF